MNAPEMELTKLTKVGVSGTDKSSETLTKALWQFWQCCPIRPGACFYPRAYTPRPHRAYGNKYLYLSLKVSAREKTRESVLPKCTAKTAKSRRNIPVIEPERIRVAMRLGLDCPGTTSAESSRGEAAA